MLIQNTSTVQASNFQEPLTLRDSEAAINSDRYYQGYSEGVFGCDPTQPEQHSYWEGYQIGAREYWASKLGVEIPTEF